MITVVDPHRPGHELNYYPGEVTLRQADVVVINKMDSSSPEEYSNCKG
jgi:predicted GTPase